MSHSVKPVERGAGHLPGIAAEFAIRNHPPMAKVKRPFDSMHARHNSIRSVIVASVPASIRAFFMNFEFGAELEAHGIHVRKSEWAGVKSEDLGGNSESCFSKRSAIAYMNT